MSTEARTGGGKHLIAGFESGDCRANRFNFPGKIGSQDRLLGSQETRGQANTDGSTLASGAVAS
jgi:hypothetical protein